MGLLGPWGATEVPVEWAGEAWGRGGADVEVMATAPVGRSRAPTANAIPRAKRQEENAVPLLRDAREEEVVTVAGTSSRSSVHEPEVDPFAAGSRSSSGLWATNLP